MISCAMLPVDVIYDHILTRLPPKSLLKFRCVCKSWRFLIDNNKRFVEMHLQRSKVEAGNSQILAEMSLMAIRSLMDDERKEYCGFMEEDYDVMKSLRNFTVRCSFDGLLCLEDSSSSNSKPIVVVNPVTRRIKILPVHRKPNFSSRICQLYRDPSSGFYKLLLVCFSEGYSSSEICSLESNTATDHQCRWKEICFPFSASGIWSYAGNGVRAFVNNAFHWLNFSHRIGGRVIAFDTSSEKFREIEFPDFSRTDRSMKHQNMTMSLLEIRGSLHLLLYDSSSIVMEMWKLQDYGNEIWGKIWWVGSEGIPKELQMDLMCIVPVSAHADDEIVFWWFSISRRKHYITILCSNYRKNMFRNINSIEIEGSGSLLRSVFPFVETLVSLQ